MLNIHFCRKDACNAYLSTYITSVTVKVHVSAAHTVVEGYGIGESNIVVHKDNNKGATTIIQI